MPEQPSDIPKPAADSTANPDERFQLRLGKRAPILFLLLFLFWLVTNNRAWSTPLVAACVATTWSMVFLARRGLLSRVKGPAQKVMVVGLLAGFFFASGGWAYTYGGGQGLTLTLEAPSGPVSAAVVNATSMKLNYSFTNVGTERLRFDPGSHRPTYPPVLHLYNANGTLLQDPRHVSSGWRVAPVGGFPDRHIELGPGESWRGNATWPLSHSLRDRQLPAGDYVARLSWQETDCNYSWLPCFVGSLESNNVVVHLV